MTDDADYLRGREIFDKLVRGDAMIGLIADVPATERKMMTALWKAAERGHAPAYRTIAECYLAALRAIGAYEGIDPADADSRKWSAEASAFVDDEPSLQAALRAYAEAARLGDREGLLQLAKLSRSSDEKNKRLALAMLQARKNPNAAELYQRGLVQNWLDELEASHASHMAAADAGSADAMFELHILYAQGLGVAADPEVSWKWLERAAAVNHPRALYNVGAAHASGSRGAVDMKKAAEYYERAAGQGNGRAACTLAVMILQHDVDGTAEDAARWLDTADQLGYPSLDMLDTMGLEDPRDA
jgi:TPR repeat protein